jgi:imidazolonepropionase-like amidohydrolase
MLTLFLGAFLQASTFAITNVTVFPITSEPMEGVSVVVEDGKILSISKDKQLLDDIEQIDGTGKYLMPGLIDVHSHMGVYPWPSASAHGDGNEMTSPITARVKAEDSFRVQDPAITRARAGGVTTIQVLPGSANLIGGEAVTLKLRPARTLQEMRFEGAPRGIKMACGENPKRVYKNDEDGPQTRMGNLAYMRQNFQNALDYREARKGDNPPPIDHNYETLLDVIDGEILVHIHCYRHDDIEGIYRVMDSYNIHVTSFQHALEAYKVRDIIISHGTAIATWPDWWGFKMEAYDATPYNATLFKSDGGVVALHSDSANTIQRMYTEAAKMLRYGSTEQQVLEMITIDPAKMLGIDSMVGSIEVGKQADLALFTKHPLDAYTLVEKTWIDGELVFDRVKEGTPDAKP